MGISVNIVGFRPADEKWKKMKDIWDAYKKAEIVPPQEVINFFSGSPSGEPDDSGIEIDLMKTDSVDEWYTADNSTSGYQIDLSKIPDNITKIRFYRSC